MKLNDVGEFGLIDLIDEVVGRPESDSVLIGIGDDAACWRGEAGLQLDTVDVLVEGVHFTLGNITWKELGWKALAVNLSDIAAMGGVPRHALVSLGLPEETDVDDVIKLYRGMLELAKQFGVDILGGDVVKAPLVVVSVSLNGGVLKGQDVLRRSGAVPGELVAVTGSLGVSAAGLAMLSRGLTFSDRVTRTFREAHMRPKPRVLEGQVLSRHGVKAAIDVSDGLVGDLGRLCSESGVGARLFIEKIPVHPVARRSFGDEAIMLALVGGEDYELLFSASRETIDGLMRGLPCPVTVVGEVVSRPKRVTVVDEAGVEVKLSEEGWEHFHR